MAGFGVVRMIVVVVRLVRLAGVIIYHTELLLGGFCDDFGEPMMRLVCRACGRIGRAMGASF